MEVTATEMYIKFKIFLCLFDALVGRCMEEQTYRSTRSYNPT